MSKCLHYATTSICAVIGEVAPPDRTAAQKISDPGLSALIPIWRTVVQYACNSPSAQIQFYRK